VGQCEFALNIGDRFTYNYNFYQFWVRVLGVIARFVRLVQPITRRKDGTYRGNFSPIFPLLPDGL
jgi:hypothetical protein